MLYCLLLSTVSVEQEVIRIASKIGSNLFIVSLLLKRLSLNKRNEMSKNFQ